MEENLLVAPPTFKLYSNRSIYIGTFLGGPLAAGYLIAENFKALGQPDKIRNTWIIAILATIAIFVAAFLIPGLEKIPPYIVPLIYTTIAQFILQRLQGPSIKLHDEKGGFFFSVWRAVLIGIIGVAITIAIAVVVLLVTDKEVLDSLFNR
ncbi:MAG TPA: hypothetical protein VK666_29860 [Chryseolinea sp.]|nr:hypothetical protein [Chryseolinea sp.]